MKQLTFCITAIMWQYAAWHTVYVPHFPDGMCTMMWRECALRLAEEKKVTIKSEPHLIAWVTPAAMTGFWQMKALEVIFPWQSREILLKTAWQSAREKEYGVTSLEIARSKASRAQLMKSWNATSTLVDGNEIDWQLPPHGILRSRGARRASPPGIQDSLAETSLPKTQRSILKNRLTTLSFVSHVASLCTIREKVYTLSKRMHIRFLV